MPPTIATPPVLDLRAQIKGQFDEEGRQKANYPKSASPYKERDIEKKEETKKEDVRRDERRDELYRRDERRDDRKDDSCE